MPGKIPEAESTASFGGSSFKYNPLQHLKWVFIRFCEGLFSQAPIGSYHWTNDPDTSEIYISAENELSAENINKRPGIRVARGPLQFYSPGYYDTYKHDPATGRKEKGVLLTTTMILSAVDRNDVVSENLAFTVAEHVWLLNELLHRTGIFETGRNAQVGAASPAGSIVANDMGSEFYATSITFPVQLARNSSFTPLGKRIVRAIETAITTRPSIVGGSQGYPDHEFEFPISTTESFPDAYVPGASDARGRTPDPAGVRQDFLPLQPHPLNPAKIVHVRTVRTRRSGSR